LPRRADRQRAIERWARVGYLSDPATGITADPVRAIGRGGMRQRIMIAIAICDEPALVIAGTRATSARTWTITAEIIALLRRLRARLASPCCRLADWRIDPRSCEDSVAVLRR